MLVELDAKACLRRVQEFIRDEIARREKKMRYPDVDALEAMTSLADDVDQLCRDITREDD